MLRGGRYRAYGGYCAAPEWLSTATILDRASTTPAQRQSAYRAAVGMGIRRFDRPLQRDRQQRQTLDTMRRMLDVKT